MQGLRLLSKCAGLQKNRRSYWGVGFFIPRFTGARHFLRYFLLAYSRIRRPLCSIGNNNRTYM